MKDPDVSHHKQAKLMTCLEDLEEWSAIRAVQPTIQHNLKKALHDRRHISLGHFYFDSLEHLWLELAQIQTLDPQQTLSGDASMRDVKSRLNAVLAVLEEIPDEQLILHETSESHIPEKVHEPYTTLPERALHNYPRLQRLARATPPSANPPFFQIIHSKEKEIVWKCAARTIKTANKFLESLSRRPESPFVDTRSRTADIKINERVHNFADILLKDIQAKISECQYTLTHDVLFTVPAPSAIEEVVSVSHLDLLLKSCRRPNEEDQVWQGASCRYSPSSTDDHGPGRGLTRSLENLCETIKSSLEHGSHLHLTIEDEKIVRCDSFNGAADLDEIDLCRSLGDLLDENQLQRPGLSSDGLTDWEKRTLALNLSYVFLHLYDCEWTASRWTAYDVQLAFSRQQQKISRSPPYLKCSSHSANVCNRNGHYKFLNLAKLLVEIDLGERIKKLKCDRLRQPNLYLTLIEILECGLVGGSYCYKEAVEQCLRLGRGAEEPESMRNHIYQNIVRRLQDDLLMMEKPKSDIRLLQNDMAFIMPACGASSTMDIDRETTDSQQMSEIGDIDTDKLFHVPLETPNVGISQQLMLSFKQRHSSRSTVYPTTIKSTAKVSQSINAKSSGVSKSRKQTSSIDYRQAYVKTILEKQDHIHDLDGKTTIQLFENIDAHTRDEHKKASAAAFFNIYRTFREHVLKDITLRPKIKVCVIDTGIDLEHPAIHAARLSGAIKEKCSFMKQSNDTEDNHGHGTHMVELILKCSENVEIFVAKIANGTDFPVEDIEIIADAINHAVREWKVDIITMSFGFRDRNEKVDRAISEAVYRRTLLFAAAANHGGNGPRTWPAQNRHVICISASDGKGKDGGISPAAIDHDDNFMTLGMSVPLTWKNMEVYRSGTSYATPLAVGFAINVLEICSSTPKASILKNDQNMRCVLRLFSNKDNRYDYIAPWILWNECRNLKSMIDRIDTALR